MLFGLNLKSQNVEVLSSFQPADAADCNGAEGRENMMVKVQCEGRRVTGIRVDESDVRRYFPEKMRDVELQLGDLRISCGLTPSFWSGEPELRDPRLCVWLESRTPLRPRKSSQIPVEMVPSGEKSFRLQACR